MTTFLLFSVALAAGALLFVIPPLLGRGAKRREHAARRAQAEVAIAVLREQLAELKADHASGRVDDASFERTRSEIEQRVLEEGRVVEDGADQRPAVGWAIGLLLVVPLSAALVYGLIGEPDAIDPRTHVAQPGPGGISPEEFSGMVAKLVHRLEEDPSDVTGWMMLARSYMMLGQYDVAAETWTRIGDKAPNDPAVLIEWADLLVGAQEGDFEGEPRRLVARTLELEPEHFKGLALAGADAFEGGDYARASELWERILAQIPPQDPAYASVAESINEARRRGDMEPLELAEGAAASAPALEQVRGTIHMSARLAEMDLPAEATVFVFARPPEGGMPFAALRFPVSELPAEFDFASAQRMNDAPLPHEIIVAARVSMTGNATPQPGDLESLPARIHVGEEIVELLIDRIRE